MSKLASVLKWVDFAKVILPVTLAAAGVSNDTIAPIVEAVGEAEIALGPGTGQQKLAAVVRGNAAVMKAAGAAPSTIETTTDAIVVGLNAGIRVVNDVQKIHNTPELPIAQPAPPASSVGGAPVDSNAPKA